MPAGQQILFSRAAQAKLPHIPLGKSLSHFFTIQDSPDSILPLSNLTCADRK